MTRTTREESAEIKSRKNSKQSTGFFAACSKAKDNGSKPKPQQKKFRLPTRAEKEVNSNSKKSPTPPPLRYLYSVSPRPCSRGFSGTSTEQYGVSHSDERSPSGRKAAGMHIPASGVRNFKDYLSGSLFSGKNSRACCSPRTSSATPMPNTRKAEPPRGGTPNMATGILRDQTRRFSDIEYSQNFCKEHFVPGSRYTPSPHIKRKCQTPEIGSSVGAFSFTTSLNLETEPATPVTVPQKWATMTDDGYAYKRCQYLEAEVEYLRDREAELRERLCQVQSENTMLSSEIQKTKENWKEALSAKRKADDAFADQTETISRLRTAYSKKLEEIRDLQTRLEEDKQQWMESLRKIQEEVGRQGKENRQRDLTDSDSDISLNEFFDSYSPPSSTDSQDALSSSRNNSPGVSPRTLNDLQSENKRLSEENNRLKADYELLQKNQRASDQRQQLEKLKQEGNKYFQRGGYKDAFECYTQALKFALDDSRMQAILHSNNAATLINMDRHLDAIVSSYCAISLDSTYLRAYQRRADAYEALGDISAALQDLQWIINSGCRGSSIYHEAEAKVDDIRRKYKKAPIADPYKVLGLLSSATSTEVKSQFRKLALQFHPDKAKNQEGGAEVFKLISQANSILSDEAKRRRFDLSRQTTHRFDY